MIRDKLGLKSALMICKFHNNDALKNTLPRLKYIQEMFRKVKTLEIMEIEAFLQRKKAKLAVGGLSG